MLCHVVYCTFCAGTLGLLLPLMVQTQNAEFDWTKTRLKSGQCQLTQISVHCWFSLEKGLLNGCVCVCVGLALIGYLEIIWAMRKLGVEEWLVSAVMPIYTGAKTVVRTVYGRPNSKGFEVKVGMHQGSALGPLLFVIVMETIS